MKNVQAIKWRFFSDPHDGEGGMQEEEKNWKRQRGTSRGTVW
jgi:hypothetical protein